MTAGTAPGQRSISDRSCEDAQCILARRSKLSPDQFQRRFVAANGCTPGQHLRRCRLRLAQELLMESDLTIPAVARRCGLGNASALWKSFRAAGLPAPAHWREEYRQGRSAEAIPPGPGLGRRQVGRSSSANGSRRRLRPAASPRTW